MITYIERGKRQYKVLRNRRTGEVKLSIRTAEYNAHEMFKDSVSAAYIENVLNECIENVARHRIDSATIKTDSRTKVNVKLSSSGNIVLQKITTIEEIAET